MLLAQKSLGKVGIISIEGTSTCPPGALRIDAADLYPLYVVKIAGMAVLALDIGRDA